MKTKCRFILRLAALGAAGFLAATASAQPTNNPNNFNDAASTTSFVKWWGIVEPTNMTWDATQDALGNPSSGSVRYDARFTGAANEQFATWFSIANRWGWDAGTVLDGTIYTNLAFDIKVDPVSAITPGANYGYLEVGLTVKPDLADPNSWAQTSVKGINIPLTATNWTHVNMPIEITAPNLDKVVGFFIKMWSNGAHTNSLIFNLDNVAMQKPEVFVPLTPPTMGLTKAEAGLTFVAASGGQYDRQSIRTAGSNYTWVGASGPVSYSINVARIGQNDPSGFQFFIQFVPGGADPTRPDSDWHEPNIVMWRIMNQADGSAWSDLRYKTNSADSNGHMWDTGGFPGGVGNATPAGTWTITFSQNTNIVITAPGGGSVTNVLPPEVVAIFNANPAMQINVGVVPGEMNRIGQMAVTTGITFTGTPGAPNLNSTFVGAPLYTNAWKIVASSPTYGVIENPSANSLWLTYTLPALNFRLQSSTTVESGSWTNSPLTGFTAGSKQAILVKQDSMPGPNSGYFRLMRESVATRLIVILPGETFAPGTATGKTGTPINQPITTDFNLTVQMVDKDNYPVRTATDVIRLSATPAPGQTIVLPADAALVNGAVTMTVSSWDPGAATLTAVDITNPTIQPGSGTVTFE